MNSGLHINESSGGTGFIEHQNSNKKKENHNRRQQFEHSRINSFVALLDRDGLPGASNLPYFFFDEVFPLTAEDEMLDDVKELELLTV